MAVLLVDVGFGDLHSTKDPAMDLYIIQMSKLILQSAKKQLCDYIIENGEYATQELLKKAVSYRFAYSNYAGNPEVNNSSCEDQANNEEIQLIRDIVCLIVKDYNFLRKELKMEYNENEIKTGILIL